MMRIKINAALGHEGLSDASKPITKEEQDHLFDVVVELANFADEKGLGAVSDKLEDALDMLLEQSDAQDGQGAMKFSSSRHGNWTSSRRVSGAGRKPALLSELKKARRARLSSLS